MNKYTFSKGGIGILILRLIFLSFSIVFLYNYFSFKNIIKNDKNINYHYVSKEIHNGRRTKSYSMDINFKNKEYTINITSKQLASIDDGKYPLLYYDASRDMVFSEWEKKRAMRIFFIFASIFGLSFVKIKKKELSLDTDKKKDHRPQRK